MENNQNQESQFTQVDQNCVNNGDTNSGCQCNNNNNSNNNGNNYNSTSNCNGNDNVNNNCQCRCCRCQNCCNCPNCSCGCNYCKPNNNYSQNYQPPKRTNIFAVIGFIASFFSSIAGLIFSIIGYNQIVKNQNTPQEESGKGLAVAGLIISAMSIVMFFFIFLSIITFPAFWYV